MKNKDYQQQLLLRQVGFSWRRILLFFILHSSFFTCLSADPISGLLSRVLPHNGDAKKFEWRITSGEAQQFMLSCDGRKVRVTGSDAIAIATGINWYLQHYAGIDISWNSPTATLPSSLPACAGETHTASVPWRYYLNFCTYSYSMAFWDWERWQQELDWMALHGINMPLAITGMECVWKEVLMKAYGYTLDEVNTFVCGSAYYGWFFMNNLTAWGGPQPESWYTQQQMLGRKIFQRMKDFGMQPVIPGYVGMIPKDFMSQAEATKITGWKASDIVNGGNWCSFVRPYFVNETARLKEFAANYYAAFEALFGDVCDTHFYAIDPFHEGGVPGGVTSAAASVAAMWEALTTYDAKAVWVAQHWQENPTTIVTHTIPRGRLIILDLHGDQYADTECSGHHTSRSTPDPSHKGGESAAVEPESLPSRGDLEGSVHDWVWGQVSNFGGNVGLFGRVDRLIDCFYAARNNKAENHLVGIGALPEGIENNAMLYDLLYALPWTNTDYTRATWVEDYVRMRYGFGSFKFQDSSFKTLLSAWQRLAAGIYQCPNDAQQGTTESVFLMRPSLTAGTVSSWANSTWYWDFADLRTALREMLSVSDELKDNDNYRYDLVDITRQALADYGKVLLDEIKMKTERLKMEEFLGLILDQDRLLGTRSELRLGRWTEAARALGSSPAEKDLYEKNARMLLTTWGDRAQCENGGLHDYANREWQGLLAAYYYPRWKAFFANGCMSQQWFADYEWPFVNGTSLPYNTFKAAPEGDEIQIAQELYDKYLKQ
ncbi:MAG: alpha-N-acetylglucosaminidase [Prevotella sp.]|nr:alpha-N-acetylglucosaminidase [Prevotella sp.]